MPYCGLVTSAMQWAVVMVFIIFFFRHALATTSNEARDKVDIVMPGGIGTLGTVLGAIGFIKLKIMLSLITAFFVVGLLSKVLGGLGTLSCGSLGIACPPGVSGYSTSFNAWSQPDYTHYDSYRSQTDETNFLNSIARSIDVMDVSFNVFGIENEVCKKKFVCMMDNEALQNPFFDFILKILGNNLSRYREFGTLSNKKDCDSLYSECNKGIPTDIAKEFQSSSLKVPVKLEKKSDIIISNAS